MRGLVFIPTEGQIAGAFEDLQSWILQKSVLTFHGALIEKWALYSQWVRFDARLGEIWVESALALWQKVPVSTLNQKILEQPWAAVAGVLLDQVELKIPRQSLKPFRLWKTAVLNDLTQASGELFFIGTRAFAGGWAQKDAELSILPYTNWGYLGTELLFNKAKLRSGQTTLLQPFQRESILNQLYREKRTFTIQDYIERCEGFVSKRQAQYDLKAFAQSHPKTRVHGRTRSRFYSRR